MYISIDQALENCLETLTKPNQSIESCAAVYPGQDIELVDLLGLAQSLTTLNQISPRAQFVENAAQRLVAKLPDRNVAYHERTRPIKRKRQLNLDFRAGFRIARYAIAVLLVLSILSSGTALAANSAAPGDLLYGIDLAVERIQLNLATSPEAIARLHLKQADERLVEADKRLVAGDVRNGNSALEAYESAVDAVASLAANEGGPEQEKLMGLLETALERHHTILEDLFDKVPEQAKFGIGQALMASGKAMVNQSERLLNNYPRGSPDDKTTGKPEDKTTGKPEGVGTGKPEDKTKGKPDFVPTPKNKD